MTDHHDYWIRPADQDIARYGEFRLTLVQPPFPAPATTLLDHDVVRAREFAGSLLAVEDVLAEVERIEAVDRPDFATRADLDLVSVGCWGTVTEVNDPALACAEVDHTLLEQAEALAAGFPGAVVVGSATVDHPTTYGTHVIHHPGGARLFGAGWSGEGDWLHDGSAHAVAEAFGIGPGALAREGVDLDAPPGSLYWQGLARLALLSVTPMHRGGRVLSVFRVRHTEKATGDLEDTWLGGLDDF
ncbi:DUF6333 family protein [Streptomyces roseicoloratus]|uniref:DUF6333 family protein n=1 Tax=Streptomyces roseicoloratus TaxID=2508722 RepID=A0ABY9RPZ3_9ACTN|nr:DUF6333 family protein [Streptomyces roseicoloratus]WMX43744.1 DUF6333 family protein [Streptomyces roseicoloratus]